MQKVRIAIALVLLTCSALGLRLWGIGAMLPERVEPDTQIVQQAAIFRGDAPPDGRTLGAYPHLLGRILSILPARTTSARLDVDHLEEHLAVASSELLRGRKLSAWLSVLAIPGTYFLARRWLSPAAALLCAFLISASMLAFVFAQQARPHAAFTSFSLLATVAALRARERGDALSWTLYGAALCLALCCLHTGAFLLPMGLMAAWLGPRHATRRWWHALAATAVALGIALATCYPFLFAPVESEVTKLGQSVSGRFPHVVLFDRFDGGGFLKLWHAMGSYDPWLRWLALFGAVAVLYGAIAWWRNAEQRAAALVMLSFALPYGLVIGIYTGSFERFLLPLFPALAVLCVAGTQLAAHGLARAARTPIVAPCALGALLLLLIVPFFVVVKLARLRAMPNTLAAAAAWLASKHPQGDATLLVHGGLTLPMATIRSSVEARGVLDAVFPPYWNAYVARQVLDENFKAGWQTRPLGKRELDGLSDRSGPAELQRVRNVVLSRRADYLVIRAVSNAPETAILLSALADDAALVARFPDPEGGQSAWGLDLWQPDFWFSAWRAQASGPALEIHRLGTRQRFKSLEPDRAGAGDEPASDEARDVSDD
ncbi:MAG: hypothetical protein FJ299_06445 [Planctomycetes bacterium]|nr:hypothetical protein [Planctomycetota bacterium]